ncbi:MAG: DUF2065 domain-containing protein [Rhodobacterales bacterium]|nr:DUF2065 domain-containing protein [Pseudomonadota bacterium]MDA1287227.1 DUF2065 domain-containing protein [Pseudomonadota bacterium]NQW14454.1 DUF2065 domain-containing protein [Rhodobacter sp.]
MTDVLTALGLVAVIEGLVLALAPLRFEDLLETLRRMDVSTRRTIGLIVMATGVGVIWVARYVFM